MSWYRTVPQYIIVFLIFSFIAFLSLNWSVPVYSNEFAELEDEIDRKTEELNQKKSVLSDIEKRIKEISGSNYTLTEQINLLNKEISSLQKEIDLREEEIGAKLEAIAQKQALLAQKKELLDMVSSELYMQSRYDSGQMLFSFKNLDLMLQNLFVKRTAIGILVSDIEQINGEFSDLNRMKEDLENEKEELDAQKKDLDSAYALLAAEKSKIQAELNAQIATKNTIKRSINGLTAELSDLQYKLIIVRQGGTHVNPDSVPVSGDYNSTLAGFLEKAPSGSFAVFSIGAYTHRNGMSQWGAKARDDAGQSYNQILSAYYPGTQIRTGSVVINGVSEPIMENILVDGYGSMKFEDYYLHGIREINPAWNTTSDLNVLKAQVIAARTYAVRRTSNGRSSICTTESCQVYSSVHYTGAWVQAINETRGQILTDTAGTSISTQYAAVHGGWGNQVGWDTTDGSGSGDWMNRAWDRLSNVSWFYKAWYRRTYSETSSTCARYPWLSQTEMSDIVNIYQIWKANGGKADSRIYPIVDACHENVGQYTYSEARAKASKPVTSISSIAVSSSNGTSTTVTFNTNVGIIVMTGNEFKTIFNLRAPGHLRIPQVGFVHINIHKK